MIIIQNDFQITMVTIGSNDQEKRLNNSCILLLIEVIINDLLLHDSSDAGCARVCCMHWQ